MAAATVHSASGVFQERFLAFLADVMNYTIVRVLLVVCVILVVGVLLLVSVLLVVRASDPV